MTPTIYGGPESLLAQSSKHLRERTAFAGCDAGHTFFHAECLTRTWQTGESHHS